MSQKEVRDYVVHKGYCDFVLRQLPYCTCGLDKALSEPPDVVVLARDLEERYQRGVKEVHLGVTADYIQDKFGFRLTADGWKWVEEGE